LGGIERASLEKAMVDCLRILVATTSQNLQTLIRRMLSRSGYETQTVDSAADALAAAREGPFAAIVTDMHLPDCCGATLIASLRSGGVETPAILLVEQETARLRDLTKELGDTRCLACPDLDGLKEAIVAAGARPPERAVGKA
jgi:CheY-like chemotaxis protein